MYCVRMCVLCTYVCIVYVCVYCVRTCVLCTYVCIVYVRVYCVRMCVLCTYVCTVYIRVCCVRMCVLCTYVCIVYVCVYNSVLPSVSDNELGMSCSRIIESSGWWPRMSDPQLIWISSGNDVSRYCYYCEKCVDYYSLTHRASNFPEVIKFPLTSGCNVLKIIL